MLLLTPIVHRTQQRPPQQQAKPRPAPRPVETPPRGWDPTPWEDAIGQARDVEALRKVHRDAANRKVLGFPISNGESIDAFLTKCARNFELSARRAS